MWLAFKTKLTTLMKMCIPQKTVKGNKNNKQWINREVKSALRRRNKLFKKKKASQKPSDIKKYKDAKATAERIQSKAYWEYENNIIEFGDPENYEKPGKQNRFWSYIKSLRNDTSGVSPLKENDKMHADPKDKADILNGQHESVFTKEDTSTTIPKPAGNPFPSMPDINISEEGVLKLLLKINPNKACGLDLITARILKDLAREIAPFLTKIFQMMMSQKTGSMPTLL
jgi:hypothetical protein